MVSVVNGILYAIGGAPDFLGPSSLATVEAYDPVTDTWHSVASMPTARTGMSSDVVDGTIYVVGGSSVSLNSVLDFNEAFTPFEEQIGGVIDDLQAIVDSNPSTELADEVEDAIEDAQEAFNALTETPPDNEAAVESIGEAVEGLQEAVDDGLLDAVLGTQLMDEFARVARQLAVDAINQAIAQGGDPEEIQEAEGALADGDADRASGAFEDALNNYEDALEKAEDAIS